MTAQGGAMTKPPDLGTIVPMATLKDRLKCAMEEMDISQVDLAERSGVSRTTIGAWWRGDRGAHHADREKIKAVATALNVDPRWLQGEDVDGHPRETAPAAARRQIIALAVMRKVAGKEAIELFRTDPIALEAGADMDRLWARLVWLEAFSRRSAPINSETFDRPPPKPAAEAETPAKRKRNRR